VNENYRLLKTLRRRHWKWRNWFTCTFCIMLKSMLNSTISSSFHSI
jgi:hypothetical protein